MSVVSLARTAAVTAVFSKTCSSMLSTSLLLGDISKMSTRPCLTISRMRSRYSARLRKVFPGSPDGTLSEVLAHHVFTELIAPSDVLIDLHGGDMVEALEPFTLYDESPVAEEARFDE